MKKNEKIVIHFGSVRGLLLLECSLKPAQIQKDTKTGIVPK